MNQPDEQKLSQEEFVLLSAPLIAAYRAMESERSDRLFFDPFAAELAGTKAKTIALQDPEEENAPYVTVRTRFFDDFLLSSAVLAPQVVILGAGMDTRAFRLVWPEGTTLYELDQPEIQSRKDAILKDTPTTCQRHAIAVDLTKPWSQKLLTQGYLANVPSVWLLEGLLMYLTDSEVHFLLKTIMELASTGSWLGLDLLNELAKESTSDEFFRGYFRSGFDNPEQLLATYGWEAEVVQPGDEEAHFGRYTRKFPPRHVNGVERLFFVKAKKNR